VGGPIAHPNKSKLAAATIFDFRKISITPDWIKICAPNFMPRDQKSNRKLIRVTSSNECLKHMCVDLSDCNRYLNQILYRTQIPEWPNLHKLKIQDGGSRHLEFRNNVNNSGLHTDIYTNFYGKMHRGHAEMTS